MIIRVVESVNQLERQFGKIFISSSKAFFISEVFTSWCITNDTYVDSDVRFVVVTYHVRKNNDSMFDITMGSFDGAEICDLVGLFSLNDLAKKFGNKFVGLYRDDGLAIIQSKSARIADKVRKEMHEIFKTHGLRITADISHQIVNFLDITLNLSDETYAPYMKPNNVPLYIHCNSNHPPTIIKQIPKSINKRISSRSANNSSFESTAPVYREALTRPK